MGWIVLIAFAAIIVIVSYIIFTNILSQSFTPTNITSKDLIV